MILNTKLFAQKLSQRTKTKTPKAIKLNAPSTWATIEIILGKQNVKVAQINPMPKVVNAVHNNVCLKLS